MSLVSQIQGMGYSLVYVWLACFFYQVLHRGIMRLKLGVLRYLMQLCLGSIFAFVYYQGLILINEGIVKLYFVALMIFGYLIYEMYFNVYLVKMIDQVTKYVKCFLSPIRFVFIRFNAIMKNTKRVIKWKRKEENHS